MPVRKRMPYYPVQDNASTVNTEIIELQSPFVND